MEITYTATITHELVDPRTGEVVDTTVEVVEHLTAERAEAIRVAQVEAWRFWGYTVRESDTWSTAAGIDTMASVRIDRMVAHDQGGRCPKHGTPLTYPSDGVGGPWCDTCADAYQDDYTGEDDLTERAIENRWAGMDDEEGR